MARTTTDRQAPEHTDRSGPSYWRFAAMIGTSTVVMFILMYFNTFDWNHIQWSETRFFMTLIMGAAMAGIMLSFMLNMYSSRAVNVAIFAGSFVVLVGALWLVRSQETVQDRSYMSAMIPHHSIAILTSERSELDDVRVCELAVEIIEAQRREIAEMEWLISDIGENGPASTPEQAESRPVPDFTGHATRQCD